MEPWILRNGHAFSSTRLWTVDLLPDQDSFDALIVMGGPMNIYEEREYPWLKEEKKFILTAIQNGKKVLGICLGAQLIANVLGAKVYKNARKEIGWLPVQWTDACRTLKPFSAFPRETSVFQWHGDTFSIPKDAVRLAGSEACENQAFLYDGRVLGLQFHLESTPESVRLLTENCREELADGPFIQSEKEILFNEIHYAAVNRMMEQILETMTVQESAAGLAVLEFPLDCQFRVIAENQSNMYFVIETVLMQHGVTSPLKTQNQSGAGKYLSFSVDMRVESLDQMNQIDSALRNIAGVKMVL